MHLHKASNDQPALHMTYWLRKVILIEENPITESIFLSFSTLRNRFQCVFFVSDFVLFF